VGGIEKESTPQRPSDFWFFLFPSSFRLMLIRAPGYLFVALFTLSGGIETSVQWSGGRGDELNHI
jgi:hypothetical protein